MYARILVPIDGSPCSDAAVEHAVGIGKAMGSTVVFLYVIDTIRAYREGLVNADDARRAMTPFGTALLDRAEKVAREAPARFERHIGDGDPIEVIVERAPGFELIVMGSHGKKLLERIMVGSVTEAVLRRTKRPLLVVRLGPGEIGALPV